MTNNEIDSKILIYKSSTLLYGEPIGDILVFSLTCEAKEHWRNMFLQHSNISIESSEEESWNHGSFHVNEHESYRWMKIPKTLEEVREHRIDLIVKK